MDIFADEMHYDYIHWILNQIIGRFAMQSNRTNAKKHFAYTYFILNIVLMERKLIPLAQNINFISIEKFN